MSLVRTMMAKIVMDKKSYQYFKFDDVFNHKRGRRLVSQKQIAGDIAYISSTATNNGLDNYISPPDYMTVYSDKMTLSNSGSVGYLFYHDYKFVASDHVMVIWPKSQKLNRYIALFLKPVFEHIRYRYNFGREITDTRLPKEELYLPVDTQGLPDWQYMENYIKDLEQKVEFKPISTKHKQQLPLNMNDWQYFQIKDLFSIEKGKRLTKRDMIKGDKPFIGAISTNNGIREFVSNGSIQQPNCITVNYNGSVGEAFYQTEPFIASDDVNILYALDNWTLNQYLAVFLCSVIKHNKSRFSYGRKWKMELMEKTELLLPVKRGEPNWQYMEEYVKSLPYGEYA